MLSVASTGIVRTPDGKAVALSPSLVGRAPAPPQWKITVENSGSALASVPSSTSSTSEPPPKICGFHSAEATSAGAGQLRADGMARRHRPRPLDVEQTTFRRAYRDRPERAGIVRHFGRHQAFD